MHIVVKKRVNECNAFFCIERPCWCIILDVDEVVNILQTYLQTCWKGEITTISWFCDWYLCILVKLDVASLLIVRWNFVTAHMYVISLYATIPNIQGTVSVLDQIVKIIILLQTWSKLDHLTQGLLYRWRELSGFIFKKFQLGEGKWPPKLHPGLDFLTMISYNLIKFTSRSI